MNKCLVPAGCEIRVNRTIFGIKIRYIGKQ